MRNSLHSTAIVSGSLAVLVGLSAALVPASARAQQAHAAQPAADLVQGMSRDRLGRIAGVMKREVDKGTFAGAVTLIARRGEIVHFEAHGFQDAGKSKPMAKDSIFRMASMTKLITTVAAMMMVEQGLFKINDPISELLPELKDLKVEVQKTEDGKASTMDVPTVRPVTIQDLMRHTSGFFYAGAMRSR